MITLLYDMLYSLTIVFTCQVLGRYTSLRALNFKLLTMKWWVFEDSSVLDKDIP